MCRWIPNYGLQLHNEEKKKIIRIQIQTLSLLYLYFEKNLQWIKKKDNLEKKSKKKYFAGGRGSVNFCLLFVKPAGIGTISGNDQPSWTSLNQKSHKIEPAFYQWITMVIVLSSPASRPSLVTTFIPRGFLSRPFSWSLNSAGVIKFFPLLSFVFVTRYGNNWGNSRAIRRGVF